MISKACGRLHILRVCKFYGYSKEDLHVTFNSLIMSVFYFAIEVWACTYDTKYLGQIADFFRRAYKFGYTSKQYKINEIIVERDRKMGDNITGKPSHPLNVLLGTLRFTAARGYYGDFDRVGLGWLRRISLQTQTIKISC